MAGSIVARQRGCRVKVAGGIVLNGGAHPYAQRAYEGVDLASLSKEVREFEEKADLEYPRFGALVTVSKDGDYNA